MSCTAHIFHVFFILKLQQPLILFLRASSASINPIHSWRFFLCLHKRVLLRRTWCPYHTKSCRYSSKVLLFESHKQILLMIWHKIWIKHISFSTHTKSYFLISTFKKVIGIFIWNRKSHVRLMKKCIFFKFFVIHLCRPYFFILWVQW